MDKIEAGSITVLPSNNLFEELGKNSYDYKDVLSELIDNSIAARTNRDILKIEISVFVDNAGNKVKFVYRDNASGISRENLPRAISPGMVQTKNSLNEHGLGMKQSIASIGKLQYLLTKTKDSKDAILIDKLAFGEIKTYEVPWDQEEGTVICLDNLKPIVMSVSLDITTKLVCYLGARYRRFLKPDNRIADIRLNLKNIETGKTSKEWRLEEVKPVYFNPSTRTNSPIINKYLLKGDGWKATFTFGSSPRTMEEFAELGIPKTKPYSPYYFSIAKLGFDVILHDRVILFHQFNELGIAERHATFTNVKGEIDLLEGFTTSITKNLIVQNKSYIELMSKISNILNGIEPGPSGNKKYLERNNYSDDLPEEAYSDRLALWLKTNPLSPREKVFREYSVEGVDGRIDIFADGELWELKKETISALMVYQLFMYMDLKEFSRGYIVGTGITPGGEFSLEHLKAKHGKEITFHRFEEFPINQIPSPQERTKYFS